MYRVWQLGLAETLNRRVPVITLYAPYSDADHIQNVAFNLLAGGRCLEHIEQLRQDDAYLNGVGVERIPDPTTAGAIAVVTPPRRFTG